MITSSLYKPLFCAVRTGAELATAFPQGRFLESGLFLRPRHRLTQLHSLRNWIPNPLGSMLTPPIGLTPSIPQSTSLISAPILQHTDNFLPRRSFHTLQRRTVFCPVHFLKQALKWSFAGQPGQGLPLSHGHVPNGTASFMD